MKMRVKKLHRGFIPAGEPCPYLGECKGLSERCYGGEEFKLPCSCGMARAFDLTNVTDIDEVDTPGGRLPYQGGGE